MVHWSGLLIAINESSGSLYFDRLMANTADPVVSQTLMIVENGLPRLTITGWQ